MKKNLCKIFGHKWEYNFVSLASKRECKRCGSKQRVKYNNEYEDLKDFETWVI